MLGGDGRQVAGAVRRAPVWTGWSTSRVRVARRRSAPSRSRTSWSRRWSRRRRTRRTGRGRRWPSAPGCRSRRSAGSGRRSTSSRTAPIAFKLSNDPLFVEKVYDVVGLYLNPPEAAVVLCVDEKSPGPGPGPVPAGVPDDAGHAREAHPRLRPPRHHQPVRRVQRRRRHRDLQPAPPPPRHRVQEVPGQDRRPGPRRPRRAPDLRQLRHPQAPDHQDLAGRATHGSACTSPRPTPPGSTRSSGCSPTSPTTCSDAATTAASKRWRPTSAAWVKAWNENPKPFVWTKTADQILDSLGRLIQRISNSGH